MTTPSTSDDILLQEQQQPTADYTGTVHPYYPPWAPIPNYVPNATPLPTLLGSFAGMLAAVLAVAWLTARFTSRRFREGSTTADYLIFFWFALCGSVHCVFEGYYVLNHAALPGSQHLLAQLWKEYALSDARYLLADPFTLCIETLTAVCWGPLCWLTVVAIAAAPSGTGGTNGKTPRRGSWASTFASARHPLQMLASMAHLYGVALYYGTVLVEQHMHGVSFCRPEFLYFWVYFLGLNAPWVVVPIAILYTSFRQIQRVFVAFNKMESALQLSRRRFKPSSEAKRTR